MEQKPIWGEGERRVRVGGWAGRGGLGAVGFSESHFESVGEKCELCDADTRAVVKQRAKGTRERAEIKLFASVGAVWTSVIQINGRSAFPEC